MSVSYGPCTDPVAPPVVFKEILLFSITQGCTDQHRVWCDSYVQFYGKSQPGRPYDICEAPGYGKNT